MSHVWTDAPRLKKCFKDEDHALAIFEKELKANIDELRKHGIFFSFTTDPMIKGVTFGMTYQAMLIALHHNVPVQILTKCTDWCMTTLQSGNWIFDNQILQKYRDKIAFGFTLTGRDDLEPNASTNAERVQAMKKLHQLGYLTFASIEPIVDLASSDKVMRDVFPYCDLYKVGLMSGGKKPSKEDLIKFVNRWNNYLEKAGGLVYWKNSITDYLGNDVAYPIDCCIDADFNIFSLRENG